MSAGAQSTWGKTFLPENICMKINKMPEFYTARTLKLTKFPKLLDIFPIDVKSIDFQIKKNIKSKIFLFIKTLKNMHN